MSARPEAGEAAVTKGAELIVYWPDDDQWYHGVVVSIKPSKIHIEYEDGSNEWINLKTTQWKLWNKHARKCEVEFQNQKRKRLENLKVGSRLCVFWPHEKAFFAGTLVEMAGSKHLIRYDDGDEEWTNLFHRKFQKASHRASRLQVGSRVVIHKSESHQGEQCPATIMQINVGLPKPHYVKYDKPPKKQEWLNLHLEPFHELEQQNPSQPSIILKKRKHEFLQDMPELQIGQGWKTKIHGEPVVEPSMDQTSSSTTTLSTRRSTRSRITISSSAMEQSPSTPSPIQCTPKLTTSNSRKKKQGSPKKRGKLTTKMFLNYMIRQPCDDDSSMMSRIFGQQNKGVRLVNHEHSLQQHKRK